MAKVRVYELARELSVESKALLERAAELGLSAKTASSSLDDSDAELIRLSYQEERVEQAEAAPAAEPEPPPAPAEVLIVSLPTQPTVAEFAEGIGSSPGAVVKALMGRGMLIGAGQPMPVDLIDSIAEEFSVMVELEEPRPPPTPPARAKPIFEDAPADLTTRPPVVTVMGHVDHGKTTLLDAIRKTNVVAGEHGGITQHIGAYQVVAGGHLVTFIDTPGHEAFTALRARGADVTDIVILVVAANDGVMPQTVEAISHAKAAGVKIVVAVNKMDLPSADPSRVRVQLTEHGVIVEDLGGDIPSVGVSATSGQGIDQLLEIVDLVAQLGDYKANPKPAASGVIIESQLDSGRGPLATAIVQRGTLKNGDALVAGTAVGRVRAMMDHTGARLATAGPSTPVLIMGWNEVPVAGDRFEVVKSEREARDLAEDREQAARDGEAFIPTARQRLQNLLEQLRGDETQLRVIVKADAHGSLEAIRDSIVKIGREDAHIEIMHGAVGGISENDVSLAEVTGAMVVGFNVRPDAKARKVAEQKGIQILTYQIIYELLEQLEQLLVDKLAPEEVESVLGSAEVRATFKVPRVGVVAGCYVTEGEMLRGAKARLVRNGVVIHDGKLGSLRRFKDDVRSVAAGFECGIGFENYQDVKEGDTIEAYTIREVARQ